MSEGPPASPAPRHGSNRQYRAFGYVVSVVRGRAGVIPGIIRAGLAILAILYAAGLELYLLLYRLGIRRATRLPCRVICVGNLTTGGTGKTPTTQMLCRLLTAQGKRVAVIIRGYGGEYENSCALVSDGEQVLLTAEQAGDEAYLLARTLPGIPVAVGRDRIRSGRLLWETSHPDVIVMDDGMQHWRLYRDLDIVLLNACEPFDNGWNIPRGMLREPKGHIRRAGVIMLTNTRRAGDEATAAAREQVAKLAPGRPIFVGDLSPVGLLDLSGDESADLQWLNGRRVGAVSALGNPASFESMLGELGAVLATKFRFRDHQQIKTRDLERIVWKSEQAGAQAVVTTEKDAVKIRIRKLSLPLYVLRVAMLVSDEAAFISSIMARIDRPAAPECDANKLKLS